MGRDGMPSPAQIAAANADLLARVEWVKLHRQHPAHTCWACGVGSDGSDGWVPERAHVVAHSQGGSMDPANFFLLCPTCHREQPDGAIPELQREWLLSHKWWVDRYADTWNQALAACFEAAGGDRALFGAWFNEIGEDGLREVFFAGARSSASPSPDTAQANAAWGIVAAFKTWLAARGSTPTLPRPGGGR